MNIDKPTSYFRTAFNNEIIENCISEFEYWGEIQSQEVDIAFEAYQKGHYIQAKFPEESALIFKLIEQGGLLGAAAEVHEKWEVLEYLKNSFSLEDIDNGKAYKVYKPRAHAEARFKELRLYQFLYGRLCRGRVPAMRAFLYVHPVLKIIVQDIYKADVSAELLSRLLSELGEHANAVISEKIFAKDIKSCIKFFEKGGYIYGEQRSLFLERGLTFVTKLK